MSEIAQNTTGLNPVDAAAKGRLAVDASITPAGIVIIGAPAPAEATALGVATGELETANTQEAIKQTALDVAANTTRDKKAAFLIAYADYCKMAGPKCKGIAANIETLALDVASGRSPIGQLGQPQNLVAFVAKILGQIRLDWDNVKGTQIYEVQICDDPMIEANWRQLDLVSPSKYTAASLVSGQKYWFRVRAKGAAGFGPWSDPATMRAP